MMNYTNSEMLHLINEHIHSERDRNILIDRFINGFTFCELEEKYDITDRQVKRIVKKADNFFIVLLHK